MQWFKKRYRHKNCCGLEEINEEKMVIFKKIPNIMFKNWNRTLVLTWNYFCPPDYIFQTVTLISLD